MGDPFSHSFASRRATPETWLGLGLLICGAGVAVLLAAGGVEDFTYLLVVAAVVLAAGATLLVVDLRKARTVSASAAGLLLIDGLGREREVPWTTVRRVRTYREMGFDGRDEHLDLVDGQLVALPRRLPDGSVERWRHELAAPQPDPERPPTPGVRVWRIPMMKAPSGLLLLQLPNLLFLASGPWAGYSAVLLLASLAVLGVLMGTAYRQDRREVRADTEALTLPRFRGPLRIPWKDIAAVGGLSKRWDDEPRLKLHNGKAVALPQSVPATVVAQWREELSGGSEQARPDLDR